MGSGEASCGAQRQVDYPHRCNAEAPRRCAPRATAACARLGVRPVILSWGQDMDAETSPFQVNLAYQLPRKKTADYVGKAELERQRGIIESGGSPFRRKLAGLKFGGAPDTDDAPDFWLVQDDEGERVGYVTSPWWSPELGVNIALAHVPWESAGIGTPLKVEVPEAFCEVAGRPVDAEVCEVPFRPSAHPSARELAFAAGGDTSERRRADGSAGGCGRLRLRVRGPQARR